MLSISIKGQVWFSDFTLGVLIFGFALAFYFVYSNDLSQDSVFQFENLISDMEHISTSLVSEGYPLSWTNNTVERIGITDNDQRINVNKLHNFSKIPYNESKKILGTIYEYFVFFKNMSGGVVNMGGLCGVGSPYVNTSIKDNQCSINISRVEADHMTKIERYLLFPHNNKSEIVSMGVYLWV